MEYKANQDMVIANVIQQAIAVILFLYIPRILGVENYGQATYVATLISFISFADLGLSFVYGRKMPAIYFRNDIAEISLWDTTIFKFKIYTGLIFSGVVCVSYYIKYGDVINSLILFLTFPLTITIQFLIASNISQQKFSKVRNINIQQSLGRLMMLPSVEIAGLRGWFAGQLIAALLIIVRRDFRTVCHKNWISKAKLNWQLIYDHLPEAVMLGLITTLWMQFLYSGRVLASFMYPDTVIAKYGVASTAYQVVASLVIAAFVPQTIKMYKMIDNSYEIAVAYAFKVIIKTLPIMIAMILLGISISPFFFEYFFPAYQIKPLLIIPLIVSLINFPAIVSLGALLVGAKRNSTYLSLIIFWLLFVWILTAQIDPYFGFNSASVAQLVSLTLYKITLLGLVLVRFKGKYKEKLYAYISCAISVISTILCLALVY